MKIAVTNIKGGVGKTTLSINLAVCLAHMGSSVCIVDTDKQQSSLKWSWEREEGLKPEIMVVAAPDDKTAKGTIEQLNQKYDFVIVDGIATVASNMNTRIIMAADLLIIPLRPQPNDLRALPEFLQRIEEVQEIKKDVHPYFIFNEFNENYLDHMKAYESLKAQTEFPILKSSLKSRTAYGRASIEGVGVYELGSGKARDEVVRFTKEVLSIAKKHSLIN